MLAVVFDEFAKTAHGTGNTLTVPAVPAGKSHEPVKLLHWHNSLTPFTGQRDATFVGVIAFFSRVIVMLIGPLTPI